MSKPYHNLPQALRGIVSEMGEKVIGDIKLVNILADVCSLDEIPAAGSILKKMLADGYGTEILTIFENPTWEIKLRMLSSKIANQNGYREDITQYIIDSIAYGLGKLDEEPKTIRTTSIQAQGLADLEIELKKLKGEYLTYLEDNVMIDDEKPAFFLTDDKSEIYEYREKIVMLSNALDKNDLSWCDDRMKEVLDRNSPEPKSINKKGFFKRLFGS